MTTRKRLHTIKRFIDPATMRITFTAVDLDDKPIAGCDLRFDGSKLNPALHREAILQGCNHSIGDAGALPAGATLKQKFDAMRLRAEWLESGANEWVCGREPGEGTILFAALMLQKPSRDEAKVRETIAGWSAGKKAAIMASEELSEFVAKVRAERGRGVDTDELFSELDA